MKQVIHHGKDGGVLNTIRRTGVVVTIIFCSLIACSPKTSKFSADSPNQANDFVSQIEYVPHNSLALYKDSAHMERYQTFDEYTMSGKGQSTNSPFVYVKKQNDSIIVFSSNKNDSVRLYIKLYNDVWYSHMEFDMLKKDNYIPTKDKLSKIARTYDRFFYNDTILEIETDYILGEQYHQLYIKCKKDLYHIRNIGNLNNSRIADLRVTVHNLILSNDKRVNKYTLREEKERYIYEGVKNDDSYSYERKAYGLWGLQPGVEETYLYGGIDIREYSDHLESYQQHNSNHIYEEADEFPMFPGGTSKFYEFIEKNRDSSLLLNSNKPNRVILEITIEKDGRITNPKVVKSIDLLHDNDALRIAREMPEWTPAKLNGKTIRFKMLIPISY